MKSRLFASSVIAGASFGLYAMPALAQEYASTGPGGRGRTHSRHRGRC